MPSMVSPLTTTTTSSSSSSSSSSDSSNKSHGKMTVTAINKTSPSCQKKKKKKKQTSVNSFFGAKQRPTNKNNDDKHMDDDDDDDETEETSSAVPVVVSPKYPVGTRVFKYFEGHGNFLGRVVEYDGDYYRIVYEDGDQEDCTDTEMETIVQPRGKRKPPHKEEPRKKPKPHDKKRPRRILLDDDSESEKESSSPHPDDDDESFVETPQAESSEEEEELEIVSESEEEEPTSTPTRDTPNNNNNKQVTATPKNNNKKEEIPPKVTPGWGFLNGNSNKKKKKNKTRKDTTNKNKKNKPVGTTTTKTAANTSGRKYLKTVYTGGARLPVLSEPQDMFDDMVARVQREEPDALEGLLTKLANRPLRVATMCSGTESPVLALDMWTKSVQELLNHRVRIEHVFSCEIEPYKQAYIERNFGPPLLFRDVRELGHDQAYTAYGSLADVPNTPGCVDLLVAGTSCVDYSNLNNKQKRIHENGESGQTWRGLIGWIRRAQPPLVILENVKNAPWDVKVQILHDMGYDAQYAYVDTKKYYIPHTRQRGYLWAVRKGSSGGVMVEEFKSLLKRLERPASAALDAFMLDNDDPRVLRGRARLGAAGSSSKDQNNRVDWGRCEFLHHCARQQELLGDKRPLTGWSETSGTCVPGFGWNEWVDGQVHRIHDLMDINTLRCATDGVDTTFKTMVWNLSQNVDRDTMGKLGLSQCLTPTGVPYVTNRGGPLVGEELLLLQGIPADDLLLTRESEDQLKDLAGNAMSSTVVGACILAALLLGHQALPDRVEPRMGTVVVPTLVPRALVPVGNVACGRIFTTYQETSLLLSPLDRGTSVAHMLDMAASSARKCTTEGLSEALSHDDLYECQECGHTCSAECALPPRKFEEHHLVPMKRTAARVKPSDFRRALVRHLPLRVSLTGWDLGSLKQPEEVSTKGWESWTRAVQAATTDFWYCGLKRSGYWTVHYGTSVGARLELRLEPWHATWFLYAAASDGPEWMLDAPVARMRVDRDSASMLSGTWELRLPVQDRIEIQIQGAGERVETWGQRLGLIGTNQHRHSRVSIRVKTAGFRQLKASIEGTYRLLPRCGTACGSLHRKEGPETMFFFLESGRSTSPEDDCFVFSPSVHRTAYREYRDVLLRVDPSARYTPNRNDTDDDEQPTSVACFVPGRWVQMGLAKISGCDASSSVIRLSMPSHALSLPLESGGWKRCPEILRCDIPMAKDNPLYQRCQRHESQTMELNLTKSKKVWQELAFATARLWIPKTLSESWQELHQDGLEGEVSPCAVCAPKKPGIQWKLVLKSNRKVFVPLEDGREAAEYERMVKKRPNPWQVRVRALHQSNGPQLRLSIGANAFSLVHRALGLFPCSSLARTFFVEMCQSSVDLSEQCFFEWRVIPHVDKFTASGSIDMPRLQLKSNKKDQQAKQPPGFDERYPLRKEQLRSLSWMLKQEATSTPFLEEEVAEAILPSLEWRVEGRVRRPVLLRGGIVADEVGYGKTAITLGLISAAPEVNGDIADPPPEFEGMHVRARATLVIVPSHLMGQWPREIEKFLGRKKNVVVIKDMNSFNKLTIKTMAKADIVVANFGVLSSEKYFARLARLAGVDSRSLPSGGKTGGRHFDAVYTQCLDGLSERVSHIKKECANVYAAIEEDAKKAKEDESATIQIGGKKTLYKQTNEADGKKPNKKAKATAKAVSKTDKDPWALSTQAVKRDYRKMQCPPLEMFFWDRVVVDEFHYLSQKADRARVLALVLGLKSHFKWGLSGTPPHETFNDVQGLATLLGIHLGIDDQLPGKVERRGRRTNDLAESEKFSNLLEVRSMQWHERRHRVAQRFLDRFVRQNIAEIDEIRSETRQVVVDLPPAERAIYLELETYLKSLDMNCKKAMKSKKSSCGDRENRMQAVLAGSQSAEEALLKRCAHFNMNSGSTTALATCTDIFNDRKRELEECEAELTEFVVSACTQRDAILQFQPDWKGTPETIKGEVQDRLEQFLQDVENRVVLPSADSEVHDRVLELVSKARKLSKKTTTGKDDDDDEEFKRKKKKPRLKADIDADELYRLKFQLREHMHKVRSTCKELCGRIQSLRFFQWVLNFQLQDKVDACPRCAGKGEGNDDGLSRKLCGVLSCCGHFGCLQCLRYHAHREECIHPTCKARVTSNDIVSAVDLGTDRDHPIVGSKSSGGGMYGAKLAKLVRSVLDLVSKDDRVIVFVQFDDLKQKVAEALEHRKVKTLQVKGTVQQQVKSLDVVQKETPDKDDPRVLLLTMDDESSAGVNLTTCNHAIFVHPLLADTQQQYDAYETQAIGRIRRYGQSKTVFIWRYLARDTIDFQIYNARRKSGGAADKRSNQ